MRRPKNSQKIQWTNNIVSSCRELPIHPVVEVTIEDVQVRALIDTGSMKSFISSHVHAILDFNNSRLKPDAINCVSITGNTLNILGCFNTSVKLNRSACYTAVFLVSDNISYDCVLGWDFLLTHHLDLRGIPLGDKWVYHLVGPHGTTPIIADHVSRHSQPLSGVVVKNAEPELGEGQPLFVESKLRGTTNIILTENISIPGRVEMFIQGHANKTLQTSVGMIGPAESFQGQSPNIQVAYAVVTPSARAVPLKIMNTCPEPIELVAGTTVAQFSPLVTSGTTSTCYTRQNVRDRNTFSCGAVTAPEVLRSKLDEAIDPSLSLVEKQKLERLLLDYSDVFSDELGYVDVVSHKIDTGNNAPIKQRPRRLPYTYREETSKHVNEMLDQNVIQPSTSAWASPVVLVRKKNGQLRFCVDYRKLNQISKCEAFPLPNISDLLDSLTDAKLFSTLDLHSAYWQIPMDPPDREKTAFMTQNGLYEFLRMPFGLASAPSTFQRMMEIVLSGLCFEMCLCYLDDVIIFSKTFDEHCERLQAVLSRFRQHNLRVKLTKCTFGARQVRYLGHLISAHGIQPDPLKIEAVQTLSTPDSIKSVRSFVGLASYYRRFIKGFSTIAAPLTDLTKKNARFHWSEACEHAFQTLKNLLCSAPVLSYPNFDKDFILQTDASDVGLGAILSQKDGSGNEKVVAYASRTLTDRERKFSATEKEALAVVFGTKHFRVYLLGRKFELITDHNSLRWLKSMEAKGRIARWIMDLQEFDFSITHKSGCLHTNVDALSRLPRNDSSTHKTHATSDAVNISTISVDPTINIHDLQRHDPVLSKVIESKLANKGRPPFQEWRDDSELRCFWFNYNKLFLRDGLLTRRFQQTRNSFPDYSIVIPKSLIPQVLQGVHDCPFAGHLGITRTLDRIRSRFFWPKMRQTVEHYIASCHICSQHNQQTSSDKAPLKPIEVGEPFTFWAMDYMGPLPETTRGNKHILVIMDHFTKWCEAFATPDQKASTVAEILVNKIFSRFGPPAVLHSDQGANFESNLLHDICNLMGIAKSRTTAYHPQCDGLVERQNRTLQAMLTAFCSQHKEDWDSWLDSVVYAYNTSRHESLGVSPYEVVFGRLPRIPLELELGFPLVNPMTQSEYVSDTRKALQDIRDAARVHLHQAKRRQAAHYDKRTPEWKPLAVGQTVWLKRPKRWKFGGKWIGPYQIISRAGVNYKIKAESGKEKVVHHNNLKPCTVPKGRGELVSPNRETGDIQVVENESFVPPSATTPEQPRQRVRPPNLRQNVRAPDRYAP